MCSSDLGPDVSMLKIWTMEAWQRLAELLEASGEGLSGTAAEQFSKPRRQH